MNRIEVNVQTGEKQVIPLTEEEIAESQRKRAILDAERAKREAERVLKEKRQAAIESLLMNGTTPECQAYQSAKS